ncbi:MAG: FlgD immunoglobulin-like domain containing protein, partial [Candidatus Electryonea clarkiae]|nr:FlgD immunoglobulin-like domain containing protein [Candidatus Electryonea clarkiae]
VVSIPDMVGNVETEEREFDVGVTPYITVNSFTGGYWFNPSQNNEPFTFSVLDNEGDAIPGCEVIVIFYEYPSGNPIQGALNPAGNNGEYEVFFGGNLSPAGTAVVMEIEAYTGFLSFYDQAFSVDYGAPSVWAISPIGEPIDNDNDGLYNEDWPDLVNQDQDYDDLNQNGVWDWDDINLNGIWDFYVYCYVNQCGDTLYSFVPEPGEPGIVDEDPIDFLSPEMPYGTEVVISIGFNDIPRYIEHPDTGYYYSAASGINTEGIDLLLNGILVDSEDYYVSNGVLTYAAGKLEGGHYVITAIIPDLAGNVGTTWVGQNANPWQFEFDIKAPAPTVDFQPLLVGDTETWIVQPYDDMQNLFRFSVNWGGNAEIVPNEVNITFIEQSSEAILDGPRTILADSTNGTMAFYSEYLGSNVIDELTPGIIFEVEATNIWDASSVSRHTYMIMHSPELSFALPSEMIYSENPLRLGNGSKGITSFPLSLTRDAYVTVEIYNFAGKKVRVLKSNELVKRLTANHVTWDGTNDNGQEVARGGYVTRIVATGVSGDVQGKKIVEMLKIGVVK